MRRRSDDWINATHILKVGKGLIEVRPVLTMLSRSPNTTSPPAPAFWSVKSKRASTRRCKAVMASIKVPGSRCPMVGLWQKRTACYRSSRPCSTMCPATGVHRQRPNTQLPLHPNRASLVLRHRLADRLVRKPLINQLPSGLRRAQSTHTYQSTITPTRA